MDEVTAFKMNFRKEQWKQLILERQASGLSINNWCQQRGFKITTYFYWLRRIRQEACQTLPDSQAIAPVPFVQIGAETAANTVSNPLTESKVQMSSKILHRGGGCCSPALTLTNKLGCWRLGMPVKIDQIGGIYISFIYYAINIFSANSTL